MSIYYDDFYSEPSEFERQIDEFKQSLINAVKQEHIDEITRLRKENAELQEFKQNKEEIKYQHEQELKKIRSEQEIFERSVKKMRLTELFGENMFIAWYSFPERVETPKCDKCNEHRSIVFLSPSGKRCDEKCPDCGETKYVYKPAELTCYKFNQARDRCNEVSRVNLYFLRKDVDGDDNFESNRSMYNKEPYEDVRHYRIAFFDRDECQKYCDWKNGGTV